MTGVRPFERADIPQLESLHARIFPDETPAPAAYFDEFFFRSPLAEPDLPSLVYEDRGGVVVGFLGVMPRRYSFRGRNIRAAMAAKLMVDPAARSTAAALALLKKFLAGPQELSVADTANAPGRILWQACRAQTIPLYNVHWVRRLRPSPSRFVKSASSGIRILRLPVAMAGPLLPLLDRAAGRIWRGPPPAAPSRILHGAVDARAMAAGLRELAGERMLHPRYDERSLGWLIRRAAAKTVHGALQTVGVWSGERTLLGWYVYYLKPRGTAIVLQVAARPNAARDVLMSLFRHAWEGGAAAVTGCLQSNLMEAIAGRTDISCHLSPYWMMVHARDPELLAAIHRGDALLTRLDGEWSMAFHGERLD